mmetsp:Transcript_34264/g.80731  ORF Transcript_34264/g.80731 Transcript_34264/m.80731 type:complete len:232 (-) Transcript_34264:63-758(-)
MGVIPESRNIFQSIAVDGDDDESFPLVGSVHSAVKQLQRVRANVVDQRAMVSRQFLGQRQVGLFDECITIVVVVTVVVVVVVVVFVVEQRELHPIDGDGLVAVGFCWWLVRIQIQIQIRMRIQIAPPRSRVVKREGPFLVLPEVFQQQFLLEGGATTPPILFAPTGHGGGERPRDRVSLPPSNETKGGSGSLEQGECVRVVVVIVVVVVGVFEEVSLCFTSSEYSSILFGD